MKKTTHSLLLAVAASSIFLPVSASQDGEVYERGAVQIRAGADSTAVASTDSPTSVAATSVQAATSAVTTSTPTAATTSSAAPATAASSSSAAQSTATKGATSGGASATTQAVTSSAVATTDSSGQVVTSFIEFTPTPSGPAPSQTNTGTSSSSDSGGGGLSTGSIIGLSVAGGIAAIAIILFFVWKFTRKRFADFDDNEAIKWPELNAHNTDVHALPTNATGRAGFGPENDSDINLTRAPSPGAYANSITASVPDGYGDPYAVPPLPHLNPSQPYHDEPGAYGQPAGYYDPYRGPVPNTFGDTMSDGHGTEAIPMTQMARMRSPGPQVVYDMQGRGSPVPQAAMGYQGVDERSRTPTSVAVSAGRASPSPNPGYGYGPR